MADAPQPAPATVVPTPEQEARKQVMQIATLVVTFVVVLNAGFYFLSELYYSDPKAVTPRDAAYVNGVRIAFGIFTVTVGAGAVAAAFAPKWVGHGIAAATGLASLFAAVAAVRKGMPGVLPATLFVIGLVLPVLAKKSLERSRAAWAFLCSLCAVYGTVLLFGAPKVRAQLGIGLWTALIPPGLLAVATISLAIIRRDYRES